MVVPRFVENVVRNCLRVRREDRVLIFAWRHMLDLAEAFALECKRVGAKTIIEVGTDDLFYQTAFNLPLEYLRESDPFSLALLDVTTANIFIQGPENPGRLSQVDPERYNAMAEADKPFYDRFLERKIRSAQISLGYVTPQRAKTYGFDYGAWKQDVHDAMDVKYEDMRDLGNKMGEMLERATEAHITSANGTELAIELEGRPAHVYDGVIDDEDIEKGAVFTMLPAGHVAVAPKERGAIGTYVSDVPEPDAGVLIRDMTLDFKNGRLESLKCGKNCKVIEEMWKSAKGDKDQVGALMMGLNPKKKLGFMSNQIVLGTVTIGLGDNRDIGGKLESNFMFNCTVAKPTVELDGKTIIKHGKLTL
ncbi:MAG TPA: aminopeptidase [candidate division Zixibacteria bacterium]|nr:aminopeptidase [candidate division Zixibacteria bacterium]